MKGDGALDKDKLMQLMSSEPKVSEALEKMTEEEFKELLTYLRDNVGLDLVEKSSEMAAKLDEFVDKNITEETGLLVIAAMIDTITATVKALELNTPELFNEVLDAVQDFIIGMEFKSRFKSAIMERTITSD